MGDNYFKKFPLINYNGQNVIDITKRVAVSNTSILNPYLFRPEIIQRNERSDQLAREYYNDPYQEWILFLTNNIQDPYDEWYLSPNEFSDYIIQKYGSLTVPQQKVKYYLNNWSDYTGAIDLSTYDSLDTSLLKYYEPLINGYGSIYAYQRVQQDWVLNTNHLVSYCFTNTIPTFIDDEIINITFTSNATGNAQVVSCTNNILNVQHVIGYYINPSNTINTASFSITGTESNSVITLTSSNNVIINIYDAVSAPEDVYYSPYSYYQYEYDKNESKKVINVLQQSYVPQFSKNLTKKLNS